MLVWADGWGKGWGPLEADLFMLGGRESCEEGLNIGLSKKICGGDEGGQIPTRPHVFREF